jgi:membrane-bound serine protease (ClpP class)
LCLAFTTLRPGGTAEFDEKRVDVVADSEYITQGTKIKVIRVEGIKVVVTAFKE